MMDSPQLQQPEPSMSEDTNPPPVPRSISVPPQPELAICSTSLSHDDHDDEHDNEHDDGDQKNTLPSFKVWNSSWMDRLGQMAGGWLTACSLSDGGDGSGGVLPWGGDDDNNGVATSQQQRMAVSSVLSPCSVATEQGKMPRWSTTAGGSTRQQQQHEAEADTLVYDFPTLLDIVAGLKSGPRSLLALRSLLDNAHWSTVFDTMTPRQYATLIVTFDASNGDRSEAAATMAPAVNRGQFTHEYVVATLRAASDDVTGSNNTSSRTGLIAKLVPLCADLDERADVIQAELSHWELACTGGAFGSGKRSDASRRESSLEDEAANESSTKERLLTTRLMADRL